MNRNNIKRIAALALVSLTAMAWPLASLAETSVTQTKASKSGYVAPEGKYAKNDETTEQAKTYKATTLPSKYDPRDTTWYKTLKKKDQGTTGLCWAFSSAMVAEFEYAHQTGSVEPVSPAHMAYFNYNRPSTLNDPLGNTLGDTVTSTWDWYDLGGNCVNAMLGMANWNGLAKTSDAPYDRWIYNPSLGDPSYNTSLAYSNYLVLKNSDIYLNTNGTSIDTIKQLVYDHGAVNCAVCDPSDTSAMKRFSVSEYSMYYTEDEYSCHAVTIIGWDDSYSKDNFVTAPPGDGAWLLQNTYGNSQAYIWCSYYDRVVADEIATFDVEKYEDGQVLFQHDGTSSYNYRSFSSGTKLANVFTSPSNKAYKLEEVSFTEFSDGNKQYNIKVYTGLNNTSNPTGTGATKVADFDVSTSAQGYHSFKLPSTVDLPKGSIFSVVITLKSSTYFATDEDTTFGDVTYSPSSKSGQSYVQGSGSSSWQDVSGGNYPYTLRIKALAKEVSASTKADISGTITGYSGSGQVKISLMNGSTVVDSTETTGTSYKFEDLALGTYTLKVEAEGYVSREYSVELNSDTTQNVEIRKLGDANCDGAISAADITRIAKHVAGVSQESDNYNLKLFDVTRNNAVAIDDATKLARYIARIITSY